LLEYGFGWQNDHHPIDFILKNSVDFVARFTEALEIKGFMGYLGFIRSHPTGEIQMFQKILKIECLREPQ